jgi:hypothetical protein
MITTPHYNQFVTMLFNSQRALQNMIIRQHTLALAGGINKHVTVAYELKPLVHCRDGYSVVPAAINSGDIKFSCHYITQLHHYKAITDTLLYTKK